MHHGRSGEQERRVHETETEIADGRDDKKTQKRLDAATKVKRQLREEKATKEVALKGVAGRTSMGISSKASVAGQRGPRLKVSQLYGKMSSKSPFFSLKNAVDEKVETMHL